VLTRTLVLCCAVCSGHFLSAILAIAKITGEWARAGRLDLRAYVGVPMQSQDGVWARGDSNLFDERTEAGRDFAYGFAEEIKSELFASENENLIATSDDGDRQRRLIYDDDLPSYVWDDPEC